MPDAIAGTRLGRQRDPLDIAVIAQCHYPITEPFAGGLEAHTFLLCRQLTNLGHRVTLFAKEGSDPSLGDLHPIMPADVHFEHVSSSSPEWGQRERHFGFAYEKALRAIETVGFDIVVNNCLSPAVFEWQPTFPVLNILHTPIRPALSEPVQQASQQTLTTFVTVSEANARSWRPAAGAVEVIYNGIDMSRWRTEGEKDPDLRWSSRIVPNKGLVDAIQAARLAGRGLLVAGPINDTAYFESEIRPQLGGDIVYVGHLSHEELALFYAGGAASVVAPLWDEPFGLVIAESLACGTPVAGYARGAVAELITGEIGSVAKQNTPEALAVAIEEAVAKDSSACATAAANRFDHRHMVSRYEATMYRMLDESWAESCTG